MVDSKTNVNNFSLKISDSLSNFNSLKIGRAFLQHNYRYCFLCFLDFIKSGVFVSSGQNAIGSVFSHSKGITSEEKEGKNSIHAQQSDTLGRDKQITAKKKAYKEEKEVQAQKKSAQHQHKYSFEKHQESHLVSCHYCV